VSVYYGDQLRAFLTRCVVLIPLLLGATLLWLLSCHTDFGGLLPYVRPYTTAILVGILMHSRLPVLHDWLECQMASYIARISYAVYIYHPLMIWGWMNIGTDIERYLLKRPISFLMIWATAHVSTVYWEEKWQALARRLTENRQRRT